MVSIREKLDTIDHLLYVTFKEERDIGILRSVLDDLIKLNNKFMDDFLIKLKEKGEIKLVPKLRENKIKIYLENLAKKGLKEKEILMIETLFKIEQNKLFKERFVDFENVEKFYKLIQKLYSVIY